VGRFSPFREMQICGKEEEEKEERKKLTGVRSTNLAKIELIIFRSYS